MAAKSSSLSEFYKKLTKEDRNNIIDLQKKSKIDLISSGSWVVDSIIGDGTMTGTAGGLPRGHIVEVFGDESSGKTTLALSAIKQVQKKGGFAALIDFEQTFHREYARRIGLDLDPNKLLVAQPPYFQKGASLIVNLLREVKPHLIVVDSVSAMLPREVMEGAIDEGGAIGLQARLMSASLAYITKFLKDSNTCLLFINQLRSMIKKNKYDTGPDEETSGGRALRYYASVRIKLKKGAVEKLKVTSKLTGKEGKEPINVTVNATVVKNKIDKPWMAAPIYIRFGEGFDNILSLIELGINTGIIKRNGGYFTFDHKEGTLKVAGKEGLRKALEEKEQIFDQLRASITVREDNKAKEDYKGFDQNNADEGDIMDEILSNTSASYMEKQKAKTEGSDEAEEQPKTEEE
jgi:recombination protein RecA